MRNFILIFLISSSVVLNAQHDQKHHGMEHKNAQEHAIGKEEIDVEKMDLNSDNKLYQCPMDWEVISDEEGRCNVCEMKLKEYSVSDVKNNLVKHNFKVKENSLQSNDKDMDEMHNDHTNMHTDSSSDEKQISQE